MCICLLGFNQPFAIGNGQGCVSGLRFLSYSSHLCSRSCYVYRLSTQIGPEHSITDLKYADYLISLFTKKCNRCYIGINSEN